MATLTNLPGVEVNISDGGLILPEDTSTQSLLIIAPSTSPNAPTQPVLVRQSNDLIAYGFGTFVANGQVNPIAAAWKAAYDAGNRRTYLMAVKETEAKAQFVELQDALFGILADFTVDHVVLHGIFADQEVDGILQSDLADIEGIENFPNVPGVLHYGEIIKSKTVLSAPIKIEADKSDKLVFNDGTIDRTATLSPVTYDGVSKKIEDFVEDVKVKINEATPKSAPAIEVFVRNGQLVIMATKKLTIKSSTLPFEFEGTATSRQRDENGTIHTANFAKLLADYAETQTLNHNTVLSYIGVTAPIDNSLANVKRRVDELSKLENEYSGYVSVIACPEFGYNLPGKSTLTYLSGAVSYAAFVSTLRAESAPTNKPIPGVAAIYYNLSLRQLNSLTGKKFVSFRLKNNRIVVTDGVTTAPDYHIDGVKRSSDYARLSTLRITQAATQLVREICEPYIGEPNQMPHYNSMNASVKGGLEAMKTQGALMDYRFSIVRRGSSLSEAIVTLEIVPAFELRRIQVNVSLIPQL